MAPEMGIGMAWALRAMPAIARRRHPDWGVDTAVFVLFLAWYFMAWSPFILSFTQGRAFGYGVKPHLDHGFQPLIDPDSQGCRPKRQQ
jgi:hypothetical protein